jgi:uncharacterized protein YjbI with pentapeptide repeats
MMRHLRDSEPVPPNELKSILYNHYLFITTGGGGNGWHTFRVGPGDTTVIFGVYLEKTNDRSINKYQLSDLAPSLIREQSPPDSVTGKQAKLSSKRLEGPLLENIYLPYADLCGIACVRQSLKGANLEGSLLVDSDLTESDFSGANLKNADLSRSDMIRVNLRNADLSGADLEDVDLTGADLRGTNMNGANLKNTLMDGIIQ